MSETVVIGGTEYAPVPKSVVIDGREYVPRPVAEARPGQGYVVKPVEELPPLIKAKKAAEIVGSTEQQIRNLCSAGKFKARRMGGEWRINAQSFLVWAGLAE